MNNYQSSFNSTLKYDIFTNKGLSDSSKHNEVFIKRIRFKPGYQRIWRRARATLKESLNLNYRYQYRLTRYLTRFSRTVNNYFMDINELSLSNTIFYSKLLPDQQSLNLFLQNKLIYTNGLLSSNPHQVVYTNDFIQLIVSKWYYTFSRWLLNLSNIRLRKFRKLSYRKGLASKYKLTNLRKQRSNYTPSWIFNVQFSMLDVKPYIEVDYFTLSLFCIYEPYLVNTQPINNFFTNRSNIYRLYNWKYIT
jgi:hypothetical protein